MDDTKKAPAGQFRVIGKDHSEDTGWRQGDYPTLLEAAQHVNSRSHSTIRFRVFDDQGKPIDAFS